ncbi:MAG: NAD-binding protein, partial [Euryarchaeota archaeon]|nr:NAD-binding protein [Euryarchaeota archaeon]
PHKKVIKDFKEDISIVLLSIIFILLSTFIDFEYIRAIGIKGVILVFLLMLLIRPIAVYISTMTSDLNRGEKIFIAAMGPRGVVPASMAVYFTLRLNDQGLISESTSLLGLIFMTIVITVLATGLSARFIANKTGVVPMEILIIGGGTVGRALAERFLKRGENVVIIDNNEDNCKKAVKLGVIAVQGDAQDVAVLKKAGIEHSKYLVATTDQDNANMLVCQIAKTNFGFTEEKLVARVNKPENLQAFRDLGIRSISPTIATAVMLDGMVGHPVLFSVCEVSGEGDIVEIRVNNKKIFGKAIKEIHLPEDSLIVMIRRKNDSIIAHPETILQDGDYVTIMGKLGAVKDAANIMK